MRALVDRWAFALTLILALAVGSPAAANEDRTAVAQSSSSFRLAAYIPEAADWAQIPPVADELDYDPLFDEDFDFGSGPEISDPFEGGNRVMLSFNRGLDRFFLDPLTTGYRFVVPELARRGVRQVFANLNSPAILANDLLQFNFKAAGSTLGRFLLNTTLGLGGLFDVGEGVGLKAHAADFGQTLARRGVAAGPYLVLPLFGPNTLRDGFGSLVDIMFQPLTYVISPVPNLMIGTGRGLSVLEATSEAKKALEESSVDYYAALRSAYLQNREAQVREEDPSEELADLDRIPVAPDAAVVDPVETEASDPALSGGDDFGIAEGAVPAAVLP
jgi:phospholipid-binding lipoprotein MlaA